MQKIRIEPYKTWSGGAKALGLRAGILRATRKQVAKHGDFDVIINWGRSTRRFNGVYINEPEKVNLSSDKSASFALFGECGVPTVPFTTERAVAQEWLDDGQTIVVRKLTRANSGRGLEVIDADSESKPKVPAAPLYTAYVKKADEYRVHVVRGEVIDVQQKRKRNGVDNSEVDFRVRNACNGWVFCRGDVSCPRVVLDGAVRAVGALGLDFGAVDIGYNRKKEAAYVYEVNTAPGLEGHTLDAYYDAFVKLLPELRGGAYERRRSQAS